jgi:hypothetical protein
MPSPSVFYLYLLFLLMVSYLSQEEEKSTENEKKNGRPAAFISLAMPHFFLK